MVQTMSRDPETRPIKHSRAERARVRITSDADILLARRLGRQLALGVSLAPLESTLIATAISELARNILQHAGQGTILIRIGRRKSNAGVIVVARDSGPGILNIRRALKDGFSTSGGLGLGLPGVRRIVDEFDVVSHPNRGTTVTAKIWARAKPGAAKSDTELQIFDGHGRAQFRSVRPNDLVGGLEI